MKRIGTILLAIAATLALAGPAHATRYYHHKVSVDQYSSVYQWDEKASVEITWGLEGHRTNQWTGPMGEFRTKTYPAKVAGDTARATYLLYAPYPNHPDQKAWALYSTKWCTPNTDPAATSPWTCSAMAPVPPA